MMPLRTLKLTILATLFLGSLSAQAAMISRLVELAADQDPAEWLEKNAILDGRVQRLAANSNAVSFSMSDADWARAGDRLCGQPGVLGCGANYCQEFLGPEDSDEESSEENQIDLEINLSAGPDQSVSQGGLQALQGQSQPTQPPGEARQIGGQASSGSTAALLSKPPAIASLFSVGTSGTERSADALPGQVSCHAPGGAGMPSPMAMLVGDSGAFSLDLPAAAGFDAGCWEVVTANACDMKVTPTEQKMPEKEPRRILATVRLPAGATPAQARTFTEQIAARAGLRVLEVTPLQAIDRTLVRMEVAQVGLDDTIAQATLSLDVNVDLAQPEYRYRTMVAHDEELAMLLAVEERQSAPKDPFAWMNYGPGQTGADRIQNTATGKGVTVVIIDTGVDIEHPEIVGQVVEQIDTSGFGLSPDRHGTAVAGIIAGLPNNGVGAQGVAPGVKILAIKACQPESPWVVEARCWSSTIAKALNAALQTDIQVINLSLGGPEDPLVKMLVEKAVEEGRIIIAAAGNSGKNGQAPFPAAYPMVMAVTAVDARDHLYANAVNGEFVDISAPGVEIPVPVPGETYPAQLTGTSMATAHISGIAALLMELQPDLTVSELRQSMEVTAVDLGLPQWDAAFGHGRVDACAAARLLALGREICVVVEDPSEFKLEPEDEGEVLSEEVRT